MAIPHRTGRIAFHLKVDRKVNITRSSQGHMVHPQTTYSKASQDNRIVGVILAIEVLITVKLKTVDSRRPVLKPMEVPSPNNGFVVAILAICSGPHQVVEVAVPIKINQALINSQCLHSRLNTIPQMIVCLLKSTRMTIHSALPKICR